MTPLIDITRPLGPATPVYPGDPPVSLAAVRQIGAGSPFSLTQLNLSTHSGTHLDPPAHFIPGGATVDQIPLERLIGPALVVHVPTAEIRPQDLPAPQELAGQSLLLATPGGSTPGALKEAWLTLEAARMLVRAQVNLVGIDAGAIDRGDDENFPIHRLLLGAGILILENLELAHVRAGRYRLLALPLKIQGGDGAPVRAVLEPAES